MTFHEALYNEVTEFSKVIGTNDAKRALAAVIADDQNFAVTGLSQAAASEF